MRLDDEAILDTEGPIRWVPVIAPRRPAVVDDNLPRLSGSRSKIGAAERAFAIAARFVGISEGHPRIVLEIFSVDAEEPGL